VYTTAEADQTIVDELGLAEQSGLAIGLVERLIGGDRAQGGDRGGGVAGGGLAVGAGEQGGGAIAGPPARRERVELERGGAAVAGLEAVERGDQGIALGLGGLGLMRLPPDPAAERSQREHRRGDDRPAVALEEMGHLLAAELVVHFSQEGFTVVRLERQSQSP